MADRARMWRVLTEPVPAFDGMRLVDFIPAWTAAVIVVLLLWDSPGWMIFWIVVLASVSIVATRELIRTDREE